MVAPDATVVIRPQTLSKPPFDPIADFAPVAHAGNWAFALGVHAGLPVKTLADYASWRGQPDKASFASSGAGGSTHFFGVLLGQTLGVPLAQVSYKGAGPAILDVVGGHIPATVQPLAPRCRRATSVHPLPNVLDRTTKNFHYVTSATNNSNDLNFRLNHAGKGTAGRPTPGRRGPQNSVSFGLHYHSAENVLTDPSQHWRKNNTRSFDIPLATSAPSESSTTTFASITTQPHSHQKLYPFSNRRSPLNWAFRCFHFGI